MRLNELSLKWDVNINTLYKMCRRGDIEFSIGDFGRIEISEDTISAYEEACGLPPVSDRVRGSEAYAVAGVERNEFQRLVRQGRIHYVMFIRHHVYSRKELEELNK